jgi:hypothetical protein
VAFLREISGAPGSARLGVIYAEKEFDNTLAMSPTVAVHLKGFLGVAWPSFDDDAAAEKV